jgi:hypothetical protein
MFKYAALTYPDNLVWEIVEVNDKDDIAMMEWPDNILTFVFLNNRESIPEIGQIYNAVTDLFE